MAALKTTNTDVAKRALVDLLTAQTQLTEPLYGVLVEYVDPAQDAPREAIFLGNARSVISWDQDFPRETANFPCYVQVTDPADEPRVTEERAVALANIVRTTMESSRPPAGANSWWQIIALEIVSSRSASESKTLLSMAIQVVSHL